VACEVSTACAPSASVRAAKKAVLEVIVALDMVAFRFSALTGESDGMSI